MNELNVEFVEFLNLSQSRKDAKYRFVFFAPLRLCEKTGKENLPFEFNRVTIVNG